MTRAPVRGICDSVNFSRKKQFCKALCVLYKFLYLPGKEEEVSLFPAFFNKNRIFC